jgi:hypothetical protein
MINEWKLEDEVEIEIHKANIEMLIVMYLQ